MLAKKTYKNQVTIPLSVIKDFPNVEYFDVICRDEEIVLRPVEVEAKSDHLAAIRLKMSKLGITEKDIENAVRWSRKSR